MAARWTVAARQPDRRDNGTEATRAQRAAVRTAGTLTRPATMGLSVRPTRLSRPASNQSLLQPVESWPARTASATATQPEAPRPASAARPVVAAVTARVGCR